MRYNLLGFLRLQTPCISMLSCLFLTFTSQQHLQVEPLTHVSEHELILSVQIQLSQDNFFLNILLKLLRRVKQFQCVKKLITEGAKTRSLMNSRVAVKWPHLVKPTQPADHRQFLSPFREQQLLSTYQAGCSVSWDAYSVCSTPWMKYYYPHFTVK